MRVRDAFDRSHPNGSRRTMMGTVIGGGIGTAAGGLVGGPIGAVAGGIGGFVADKYSGQIFRLILDGKL